jgi:dinuclear metal center YbgI/SA1388 family protein
MDTDGIGPFLEQVAPSSLAESWDNPGWQVRIPGRDVTGILVTLDVNGAVLKEAAKLGCNLVFAHHPLIFKPLKSLDLSTHIGSIVGHAVGNGISIWAAHTNLDVLPDGTSFALGHALGLWEMKVLAPVERPYLLEPDEGGTQLSDLGYGVVGDMASEKSTAEAARWARQALSSAVCTVAGEAERMHRRVAAVGGSGGSFMADAIRNGATLFITADVRYHDSQEAVARGLDLVILDHYATERPVLDGVRDRLQSELPDIPVLVATATSTPYVSVEA